MTVYNQKASFEVVQKNYNEFEPRVQRLLELADPEGFRIWKLIGMDDILTWNRNHTVLLGDACHPVSPSGFLGVSMAFEDGVTLTALLPSGALVEEIPSRLKLYEQIRKPRVGRVRDTARMIAKGLEDRKLLEEYKGFLEEHDAVEYAKDSLKYLVPGNEDWETDHGLKLRVNPCET
jgi:salicylate hydroxylase